MFDNTATLYALPFDNTYENNILFETRAAQTAWFSKQASATPARNPISLNYGSGVSFSLTLEVPGGVYRAMNYNYLVIDLLNADEPIKRIYAFITHAAYHSKDMYRYSCEIDVIQTYLRDITFAPCEVKRAHLPRFLGSAFDNRRDSLLLKSEGFAPVKYKIAEQRLEMYSRQFPNVQHTTSELSDVEKFINDTFNGWIYIFIDASQDYGAGTRPPRMEWGKNIPVGSSAVPRGLYAANIACVILPVEKLSSNLRGSACRVGTNDAYTARWIYTILQDYQAFVYGVYLSPYLAIDVSKYTREITVRENIQLDFQVPENADGQYTIWNNLLMLRLCSLELYKSLPVAVGEWQNLPLELSNYPNVTLPELGQLRDMQLNPKLYSSEFIDYLLYDWAGNNAIYDLRLINTAEPVLYVSTVISPTAFTFYARLINDKADERIQGIVYNYNYTGIVSNQDNSLPWTIEAYAQFLAQNKNFYAASKLQIQVNQEQMTQDIFVNMANSFVAAIGQAASGNFGGAVATDLRMGINGIADAATMDRKTELATQLLDYQIDSIKSSPASIANAAAAPFMWLSNPNGCVPRVILECAPLTQLKDADDFMYLYGYRVGHVENMLPSMTYRQIFNYIKANLNAFDTPYGLSTDIRNKIREVFAGGVRLWRDTPYIFTYEYENVEGGTLSVYPPEPQVVKGFTKLTGNDNVEI